MNACAFCGRKQTIGMEGTYAGPVKAWVCSSVCAGKYEARAAAAPAGLSDLEAKLKADLSAASPVVRIGNIVQVHPDAAARTVDHPPHYTAHPSGIEAITICEYFGFNVGNAIKYLWRAGLKTADPVEDLRKAAWYVNREIERLTRDGRRECPRGGHPFGSKPAECSACAGDE